MFTAYPTYPPYRTLQLTTPVMQQGEDVYALQLGLKKYEFDPGVADGIFGAKTSAAVKAFQKAASLRVDGMAGGDTQKVLAMELARDMSARDGIPLECFRGQLEHESGFRLGNYSPIRKDGSYDAGVAQRNTRFVQPEKGFDPVDSITELSAVIRHHYNLFYGLAPVRRHWALAQGSWNAPAFACWIAREEGAHDVLDSMCLKPTPDQRATFEAYVTSVSAYLQ
jgi:hypothetical protein